MLYGSAVKILTKELAKPSLEFASMGATGKKEKEEELQTSGITNIHMKKLEMSQN